MKAQSSVKLTSKQSNKQNKQTKKRKKKKKNKLPEAHYQNHEKYFVQKIAHVCNYTKSELDQVKTCKETTTCVFSDRVKTCQEISPLELNFSNAPVTLKLDQGHKNWSEDEQPAELITMQNFKRSHFDRGSW